MPPDPKPTTRRGPADKAAIINAKIKHPECAACGTYGGNGHHIIPKDRAGGGEDVEANIVVLCGSGTSGCHGGHHGSPYTVPWRDYRENRVAGYERRDAEWVNRRIGKTLARDRPDTIAYVLARLGNQPGRVFLQDTYYLEVE